MPSWTFRQHTTKAGQKIWYCRSRQPFKEPDGEVRYRPVERSSGTSSKQEARERTREFDAEYLEASKRPAPEPAPKTKGPMTFADAVGIYVRSGNSELYLEPIVRILGLRPAKDIDQSDCLEVVAQLYANCKSSTTNRQVWTPICAVLRFNGFRPDLKRPKGHDRLPTVDRATLPPEGWFPKVLEMLSPKKRALMLLINLHGLRVSEAIRRTPADVDSNAWTLSLPNTKDGSPQVVQLSEPVVDALKAYDWRSEKWLFGTAERGNISRDFRRACELAKVDAYGTHKIGRHSFAAQILGEGKSLPFLKQAGRWASLKAVERYSHLAKSEVNDEVRDLGAKWHKKRKPSEIVEISSARKKAQPG